ncbi:SDR family oxidoreductase [Pararhodobacter sp. SW119]|uniref:SDR family oxidoreductase n=1 Tax=Pararhodobacter sp. SW119 TaxID=2780075 RepID=UPI001ADF0B55|nr:SDR family oxidoreductase [Pararhodobacter sp. SW119]
MTGAATGGAVLILGARSDIARACAQRFAQGGHPVMLAARDAATLAPDATDIGLRHGVTVTCHDFDALDPEGFAAFLDALPVLPEIAVCAVGLMGTQDQNQRDPAAAIRVLRSNFEGPAILLAELAERFEARGSGTLIGISSVAGERGRASNYVYGAAKAGFTAYLSGLRNRFARGPVRVITVLPGFVATRMTEGMDLPPRLTAQPEEVAEAIFQATRRGRDVVWVRPVWRLIMAIIRALPEGIFKKTRL